MTSASGTGDQPEEIRISTGAVFKCGQTRPGPAEMDWHAEEPETDQDDAEQGPL